MVSHFGHNQNTLQKFSIKESTYALFGLECFYPRTKEKLLLKSN